MVAAAAADAAATAGPAVLAAAGTAGRAAAADAAAGVVDVGAAVDAVGAAVGPTEHRGSPDRVRRAETDINQPRSRAERDQNTSMGETRVPCPVSALITPLPPRSPNDRWARDRRAEKSYGTGTGQGTGRETGRGTERGTVPSQRATGVFPPVTADRSAPDNDQYHRAAVITARTTQQAWAGRGRTGPDREGRGGDQLSTHRLSTVPPISVPLLDQSVQLHFNSLIITVHYNSLAQK